MTPGPWTVHPSKAAVLGSSDEGEPAVYYVAECGTHTRSFEDARLIAAAPDLLEACEAYLNSKGRGSAGILAVRRMRAAVAKAKS